MPGLDLNKIGESRSTRWPRNAFSFPELEIKFNRALRLSDLKKEAFYIAFSGMVSANLPVRDVLQIISADEKDINLQKCLERMTDDVVAGESLSKAMEKSELFTPFEFLSFSIGEETGRLEEVSLDLAKYFADRVKQRKMIVSALTYPVMLITIALASTIFLLTYMVPMFNEVFKRFGGQLPWATQAIITLSEGLRTYALFLVALTGLIGIIFYRLNLREGFQLWRDNSLVKIPVVGRLILGITIARFARSMSLMLSSKIPITRSLELMAGMTKFSPIRASLSHIRNSLYDGASLHESMSKFPVFETKIISFVKVGEEVNQLDKFFQALADHYRRDSEFRITQINSLMEPMLILFLGAVVGIILIAMYLPMFELSTTLGQ